MSTTNSHAENCTDYNRRDTFNAIVWTHETTGLELEASRWGRATQMSNPMASDTDEYWRLVARHDGAFEEVAEIPAGEQGRTMSGKEAIVERATEWMRAHSTGQLEASR